MHKNMVLLVGLLSIGIGLHASAAACFSKDGRVTDYISLRASKPTGLLSPWFIIIGAPGAGKTTTIDTLRSKGFRTVPEAATQIIQEEQAAGIEHPYLADDFQSKVSIRFDELADEVSKNICPSICFFDRGPVDSISYKFLHEKPYQQPVIDSINHALSKRLYQPTVFFVEELDVFEGTEVRFEDAELARATGERIKQDYIDLGFKIVPVHRDTPENRAMFILDYIAGIFPEAVARVLPVGAMNSFHDCV